MISFAISMMLTGILQSGFLAYSFAPAMGYSAPAYMSVPSKGVHTIETTVTDKDTYQRAVEPNDFQEFPNSDTDVTGNITSGTVISVTSSYDSVTGKRTKTWVIRAPYVAPNETLTRLNTFIAKDTRTGITQDGNSPQMTTTVDIRGATP